MGGTGARMLEFLRDALESGMVDPEVGRKLLGAFGGTERPLRNQVLGLQILAEIALVLDQQALALETLRLAEERGLMDIFILDHCPLFDSITDTAGLRAIRDRVATRASRVLHAFRALAS